MFKKTKNTCDSGHCCGHAVIIVILGILFLLQDLNIWNFWNINWYTAAFLVIGLGHMCKSYKK